MAIFDQLGSMFGRRMDQAMMPFTNPGGYMDQRMDRRFGDLYETDEERRRREEERRRMEQVTGPVAPPAPDQQYEAQGLQEGPAGQAMAGFRKPQPFKQTLTTDPVTGQQTMKMEGAPQDFTAANPNTPTIVSGPAMPDTGPTPDEIMREQEQARQYQQMTGQAPAVTQPAAPPPMAAAPVAPPGVAQPAPQAQQDTTRLGLQASQVVPGDQAQTQAQAIQPPPAVAPTSQPRDLTQMAQAPAATATDVTAGTTGAVAPPPAAQPAAAAPPAPAPAAAPPAAAPAPAAAPVFGGAMATSLAAQALEQNADNTNRLLEMARDPTTSDTWKRVYAERARANVEKEDNKNKGEAVGQRAVETGRGVDRTIRKSHEPNTVGFYAKQYILRRLGLNKEADQELAKTSSTFQNVVGSDGKPYQIEVRGDGMLLAGYDGEGNKVDAKTLAEVGSMATTTKDGTPVAERVRDSKGNEWSRVNTKSGPIFFDNARRRGVPEGRTTPITAGTDLEVAQAKQDIETVAQFSRMTAQQRLNAYENTNKLRADRRLPLLSLQEMGLNADGSLISEATRRPGGAAVAQPPAAPAEQPPAPPAAQPPAPPPAAPAPAAPGGRVSGPAIPGPTAPGPRAPAAGGIPTAQEMMEQSKESDLNRTLREASERAKINAGQNLEEQKNKVRAAMPASQGNVNRLLTTLNNIATHPGLDKTVGYPKLLTTPLSMLPSSDARNFAAVFKQLGGQEFLAAYNELRGGGGISEVEGQKAEQAISALKDTGISAAEFRKNMWILQDAVKEGFDRQRDLIGLPPMYREDAKKEEAKKWLRNNPNHPDAAAVRRKLVGF